MKILIHTINSKYIHFNNSVYIVNEYLNNQGTIITHTIKDDINLIINDLINTKSDYYFFSIYIWNIEFYKQILPIIKNYGKIIVGGPEVTYEYNELLNDVDYIFLGEANESIREIIENKVESNSIVSKENKVGIVNFNTYINNKYVYDLPITPNHIVYLETSKGCPFNCSYCMSSLEKKVIDLPLENVYKQIDLVINRQIRTIKFLDRTFNTNSKRAITILNYINQNSTKQVFQFEIAPELLNDEFLDCITNLKPNTFRFEVGIQSIHDKTINAVDRKHQYLKFENNLKKLCELTNIEIHLDMICGLPFETYNDFINSFNTTIKLNPSEYQLGILKMLKGTKIRNEAKKYEYIYQETAPYTIISNSFITNNQLQLITQVENIIDRFYNTYKFKNTFTKLIENTPNVFQLCLDFNQYLINKNVLLVNYQNYDIYKWLYEFLLEYNSSVKDYVIYDYMLINKFKYKKFVKTINDDELKFILQNYLPEFSINYKYKNFVVEKLFLEKQLLVIKDLNTKKVYYLN